MPDPLDPTLNPLQLSTPPVPAVPLSAQELAQLGLSNTPLTELTHSDSKIADFVARVRGPAQLAAQKLNVPVDAIISQWALESGWGQSELASKYNNLGGIKASHDWTGNRVVLPSYEKDRTVMESYPFRVYPNVDAYAQDFTNFLSHPRYASVHGTNDVHSYGLALTKAGYSQDDPSAYAGQLTSIARRIAPYLNQQPNQPQQ